MRLPSVSSPPFVFILSFFLRLTRYMSVRRYLLKLLLEAGLGFGRLRGTLGGADLLGSSGLYLCDLPGPQGCGAREKKWGENCNAHLLRNYKGKCPPTKNQMIILCLSEKPRCLSTRPTTKNLHISMMNSRPFCCC